MNDELDGRQRTLGMALLPDGVLGRAMVQTIDGTIDDVDVDPSPATVRALRRDRSVAQLRADEVLAPAFIDIHCHGAGGGAADGDEASLERMTMALRAHGVGAFLATAMTAPVPELRETARRVGQRMAQVARAAVDTWPSSVALGAHLEGPVLSPARSAGHAPGALLSPAEFAAALDHDPEAWRSVRLVTLAPELPGALDLVRRLAEAGVVVSVGHTDASAEVAEAAYAAGARSTTHLFNGMPPLHHRAPGPVGAALAASPFIELIADGVHIDRRLLSPLVRAIGEERLILVTDALPLAGTRLRSVPTPGSVAIVRDGVAVHPDGAIAGGRALLDGILRSTVGSGIPLATALRAMTQNPARLLGLPDRGSIVPGAVADLVVVSMSGRLRRG
jgi:N-acetylglucosamine-6-phosphate deacetylase